MTEQFLGSLRGPKAWSNCSDVRSSGVANIWLYKPIEQQFHKLYREKFPGLCDKWHLVHICPLLYRWSNWGPESWGSLSLSFISAELHTPWGFMLCFQPRVFSWKVPILYLTPLSHSLSSSCLLWYLQPQSLLLLLWKANIKGIPCFCPQVSGVLNPEEGPMNPWPTLVMAPLALLAVSLILNTQLCESGTQTDHSFVW